MCVSNVVKISFIFYFLAFLNSDNHHGECWTKYGCTDGIICPGCGLHEGKKMYCCRKDWTYADAHACVHSDYANVAHHQCVTDGRGNVLAN